MIIALSLLICIVGLLMYAMSTNPKLHTVGLIMFGSGLLAFLLRAPEAMKAFGISP